MNVRVRTRLIGLILIAIGGALMSVEWIRVLNGGPLDPVQSYANKCRLAPYGVGVGVMALLFLDLERERDRGDKLWKEDIRNLKLSQLFALKSTWYLLAGLAAIAINWLLLWCFSR